MNMQLQPTTKFKISQDSMLGDSRNCLEQFTLDKTDFVAFDHHFDQPFSTNWKNAIDKAIFFPSDSTVNAEIKLAGEHVLIVMKDCRACFQNAKYKIETAFPDNPTMWLLFGYQDYEAARNNSEKMYIFLGCFYKVCLDYKDDLSLVNYTKADMDHIMELTALLLKRVVEHNSLINSRPDVTKNRLILMNEVWDFRCKVAKASKNIYQNDVVRYRLYLLPASEESSDAFNLKGTIKEKGKGKPLEKAIIHLAANLPLIYTDSKGKFGGAKIPAGIYTALIKLEGYFDKEITIHVVADKVYKMIIELEKYPD